MMISMKKSKLILNSIHLDESLVMVKNLLGITSSLQEDDTADMLTKVYHKFLELKKEKYALNSWQTVIRDVFVVVTLSNLWTCK